MENHENDFLQKLIKIVNETQPVEAELFTESEKTAEETPAATVDKATPAADTESQKVADVGQMSLEDIMQHPAFLQGVSESMLRCGPDLEAALERVFLPE